jgi:hypothetical protein
VCESIYVVFLRILFLCSMKKKWYFNMYKLLNWKRRLPTVLITCCLCCKIRRRTRRIGRELWTWTRLQYGVHTIEMWLLVLASSSPVPLPTEVLVSFFSFLLFLNNPTLLGFHICVALPVLSSACKPFFLPLLYGSFLDPFHFLPPCFRAFLGRIG